MRGAVSGGMALGLDELGLAGAFDAAYGSSAGTLNAMWLVSGRVRDGIPTWTDPQLVGELISRRRGLSRRGPVVDVEGLVEERYERLRRGCSTPCWRGGPSCTRSPPTSRPPRRSTSTHTSATRARCGCAARLGRAAAARRARRSRSTAGATSTPGCRRRSRSAPRWPTARPTARAALAPRGRVGDGAGPAVAAR